MELVKRLAAAGAKVDGVNGDGAPLTTALKFGYPDAAAVLVECGAGVDNIVFAAAAGQLRQLECYFEHGRLKRDVGTNSNAWSANPPTSAEQALVFAAMCRQGAVIRFLLDRGVNVNADPPGSHCTGTALPHDGGYCHREVAHRAGRRYSAT